MEQVADELVSRVVKDILEGVTSRSPPSERPLDGGADRWLCLCTMEEVTELWLKQSVQVDKETAKEESRELLKNPAKSKETAREETPELLSHSFFEWRNA